MDFRISELGAVADTKTPNTEILQKAIDDCNASGGGRVTVSGGTYQIGRIFMKSNVELHIASDGVLLGSPDVDAYYETKNVRHVNSARLPRWRNACLIFADECENIAITGSGKIDCNGEAFVEKKPEGSVGWTYKRIDAPTPPRAVFFTGCKNVKIEDVFMVNQPAGWSYWIHDCDYVSFTRVKIFANVNYPNNDGIHINCSRNVTVSDCCITCGDDCIIVRANSASLAENKPCEKVTVTNCNLTSYSAAIRLGWMNDGVIRNCAFSNIVITDSTTGINCSLPYMKHNPDDLVTADQGREATLVENITFSNIIMSGIVSYPIRFQIDQNEGTLVVGIRNLYFTNIHASGTSFPCFIGKAENPIKNVYLNDCTFEVTDGSEFPNLTTHGASPQIQFKQPEARHIENLRFNNTSFSVV